MSTLTKVFVGLLVVLSLLLSAASITFLYTIPNFNQRIATLQASQAAAQAQAERIRAAEGAGRSAAEARANELQALLSDRDAALQAQRAELAKAQADNVSLRGQLDQASNTMSTLSSAVQANLALVGTLRSEQASLRELYDRTLEQNLNLDREYARLSNEFEFTRRALRAAQEQNAELLGRVDTLTNQLLALGHDPRDPNLPVAPPPINGVIVQRQTIGGEPYALISVGAEDDVRLGMRFSVIDAESGRFLGFITVEEVDDQVSIGKLSGPGLTEISANDEVRTEV